MSEFYVILCIIEAILTQNDESELRVLLIEWTELTPSVFQMNSSGFKTMRHEHFCSEALLHISKTKKYIL